jgi:aldehyde dehydrogenase (NAD+)
VILKPADGVSGCAYALGEIIHRAVVPSGVFNLLSERGSTIGAALVKHTGVDSVSFTGSSVVGRQIALNCVERGAAVQFEMGGKNALVVLDDADLDTAIDSGAQGSYFSAGQRCTASSRLVVTEGTYSRFRKYLITRLRALRTGHALAAETHIGPVVDGHQMRQDMDYIALGLEEGAELVHGGRAVERSTRGYFLEPALFDEATDAPVSAQRVSDVRRTSSVRRRRGW